MKHLVIGTAGHVDHGKTLLVKALTGVDTDRLAQEKARGLTIEPGFAPLPLGNGMAASMIDLPGHERFLKNMLSGVGGVDLALLVVAADEGVMPQTVEHLQILSLLGLHAGVVALTKLDLADDMLVNAARQEVAALVKGSFLEDAPVLPVSARTGAGLQALKARLALLAAQIPAKDPSLPWRLPIDRVFSVDGFGTVVTGTLLEGVLAQGTAAAVYPAGDALRVRGLQVHGERVATACAGQRVAVNLAGIRRDALRRGDLLAAPDLLASTLLLDIRLTLLPGCSRVITGGTRLHLYHGTSATLCRVTLLGQKTLTAGEAGLAQLLLEKPLAARAGDRLILRFYSPLETIGGGIVLDPLPIRHKPSDPRVPAALAILECGAPEARVLLALDEELPGVWSEIRPLLPMPAQASEAALAALTREGRVVCVAPDRYLARAALDRLGARLKTALHTFHTAHPMQTGMPRGRARPALSRALSAEMADCLLSLLAREGDVRLEGTLAALPDFRPQYPPRCRRVLERLEAIYRESAFSPPGTDELARAFPDEQTALDLLLRAMTADGRLVALTKQLLFPRAAYEQARALLLAHFAAERTITLAQLRDLLHTSRRCALALLEHWDRQKLTLKSGDLRTLSDASAPLDEIWE